jgi:hypothetical protein
MISGCELFLLVISTEKLTKHLTPKTGTVTGIMTAQKIIFKSHTSLMEDFPEKKSSFMSLDPANIPFFLLRVCWRGLGW